MNPHLLAVTAPQRLDRDLHELEGIVRGIAIDGKINSDESRALSRWCATHEEAAFRSPFNELLPKIQDSIADGVLDLQEREDIEWLIARCRTPNEFYNVATSDMQRLHGVLAGVGADGVVNDREAHGLVDWLDNVACLRGCWPYDEIDSLLTRALADGKIDPQEHRVLLAFCQQFASEVAHLLVKTPFDEEFVRYGVCAVQPTILFDGRFFCATGTSPRRKRQDIYSAIAELGGIPQDNMSEQLDYLVVCDGGNRAWAFSSYGRKIERAMQMRRQGSRVAIVSEADLWDALEDRGVPRG